MQTVLATAMPRVVGDLGGAHLYGWVFAAYLLASTVPLPVFAQLADRVGRRRVFLPGMTGYAVGTALAALAPSMTVLVAARVVQGLGVGALVPAALAGIADLTSGAARGRLFGVVGVIQVIGTVVGPLLGGFLTDGPGWRWGLWAIVPVTLLALLLAAAGLPTATGSGWVAAWRRIDWVQPVRSLRSETGMRRISIGAFLLGVTLMSATAYLPLLVQDTFGRSASRTGVVLVPLMVGVGVGSMLGGRLSSGHGRIGQAGAWTATALAFAALATVTAASGRSPDVLTVAAGASAVAGAGIGTVQPILLVEAQDRAPKDATAAAGGMVPLVRNLGGAVGTSVLGLLVTGTSVGDRLVWAFGALALMSALGGISIVGTGPDGLSARP
jgi:MFS family permease